MIIKHEDQVLNNEQAAFAKTLAIELAKHTKTMQPRLKEACNHALQAGGKRLRPFLMAETAALLGAEKSQIWDACVAIEYVHTYSLIHDDLPALDNDDLRRGQPTTHKAFDEATAILAGDALLTQSFVILAGMPADAATRLELIALLAQAAGPAGMIAGQMEDLTAEGRFTDDKKPLQLTENNIRRLQSQKTGALITAAVMMGATLGNATDEEKQHLFAYGEALGQTFQLVDDLLDLTSTPDVLGKATQKDSQMGKATLPSLWGQAKALQEVERLTEQALMHLQALNRETTCLQQLTLALAHRNH